MGKVIVARYGEVHLKGENRGYFLRALERNVRAAVGAAAKVKTEQGRIVIIPADPKTASATARRVANVFGIVSASVATDIEIAGEGSQNIILEHLKTIKIAGTFKAEVNRADKTFPMKSTEFAAACGEVLLRENSGARVDVHTPERTIFIDIREGGRAFVYDTVIKGVGGMPVGTAGRALVMLSGGIDSPVAAWLAAKRGLEVTCVHFASPPYTSDFALDKVKRLVKKLEGYCGRVQLLVVPFTEIQEAIRKTCDEEYMITIMRRFMVRVCEKLSVATSPAPPPEPEKTNVSHAAQSAKSPWYDCIVTGESLAQVASQTIWGIASNNVCARSCPILRPLITYDKSEIVEIAKKIDTYDISTEPHLDCCTVFVPRHPMIKPVIEKCEAQEKALDNEGLVTRAVAGIIRQF